MLSATSFFKTSFDPTQELRRIQALSVAHGTPAASNAVSAQLVIAGAKTDAAISAIMKILLDAQGSQVDMVAKHGFAGAQTGDGNDRITLDVHGAFEVSSGKGNDSITIRTYAADDHIDYGPSTYRPPAVGRIDSGEGDDTISIASHGRVSVTLGGDGDDTVVITSSATRPSDSSWPSEIDTTQGGAGNDRISIASSGLVDGTNGDDGDDTIEISGRIVSRAFGDEGDDTMRIVADRTVSGARGGDGEDIIEVTAATIHQIGGGKGDDTIVLNNTSGSISHVAFYNGDGDDVVTTNSALAIQHFAEPGVVLDMTKASIAKVGENTLRVTFDGTDGSITVHLTGDMAGKPLAFDYYRSGTLVIRRDDSSAPTLPPFGHSLNPVVLTRR